MTPIAALQNAAMPELYSSMPSSPQINVLYLTPGQEIISPEQFRASNPRILATGAGTQLAKMSPSMLVKYGTHASLIEAKNMLYHMHTDLLTDFGGVYDTYIFMEFVEGEDPGKSWEKYTSLEKQMISADLQKHLTELRSLPAADYIGSNGLQLQDVSLDTHVREITAMSLKWYLGPFRSEADFNAMIVDTDLAKSKGQIGPYIRGMIDAHKHGVVFTHGDLRPDNIIAKNGRVTAIIDWEMAGWYPDHWEFVKAFYLEVFSDDWASHLLRILTPYYS
ncbi:hypothetical protein FKW77_007499 [Venturia effusa]|uniref:Aminoglycoside phosphotransferase domain-containing protein n=1 Tax=Venturia effusa TaxID=50376 RepID=A0A517LLT6_9PEZI|nr:hypothetical protein FKW77_007499 [Venturia effusa]